MNYFVALNLPYVLIIAQTPADAASATQKLAETGVLGCVVILLMALGVYLEKLRGKQVKDALDAVQIAEAAREAQIQKLVDAHDRHLNKMVEVVAAHDNRRDEKGEKILEALNRLIRITLAELISREGVSAAAKAEAEQLLRSEGK
jgi:hypothetical protein